MTDPIGQQVSETAKCKCGHAKRHHWNWAGLCGVFNCVCQRYVPDNPAKAPEPDMRPSRVYAREALAAELAEENFAVPAQVAEEMCPARTREGLVCALEMHDDGPHVWRDPAQPASAPSPETPRPQETPVCQCGHIKSVHRDGGRYQALDDCGCLKYKPTAPSPEIPTTGCPRCSIGTPIFGDHCIVCVSIPDAHAALIKEIQAKREVAESALRVAREEATLIAGQANRLNDELNAEREARKQEAVEQFNAGIEAAAKECDQFVEAYSFWTPYPDGYAYSDVESKAAALFAKGRFEVAAKKIRELEPVSGSPERLEGGK